MRKHTLEPSVTYGTISTTRQPIYGRILGNLYLRNNILLLVTNILAGIFAYLLHPFLAHLLGIQEYGQAAVLIAFSLVLVTPTQIIATIAAKYASALSVSEDYAQLNGLIRRLTALLLVVGVLITAVFIAASGYVAFFFHLNSPLGVILLSLIFIISFVAPLNQGVLQGLQRFGWYSAITLLSLLLRLILSICLVIMGLGIGGVMLSLVISALLAYLVSFMPLRNVLRGPLSSTTSLRSLWSYSLLTAATAGGIVALYSIDTVLAGHFLSAHETGLYAALSTIGRTVLFVTSSIATVMFPRIVALHERGESHTHVVIKATLSVLLLSAAVEVLFYLAPLWVTKLLYGQAFASIAGQLPLYGMAMLLLAVGQVLIMYFLAIGNRLFMLIIFLACALQIGLIVWHHTTIAQLVQAVMVTNAALVLALLISLGLRIWKTRVDTILASPLTSKQSGLNRR